MMNLCGSTVCWTVRLSYNRNDPYEAKYYRVPVESLEAFLVDAKKVPQSCEEIAVRKEKGVESQITCLAEIGPQQDKEIKENHKQPHFFSLVHH